MLTSFYKLAGVIKTEYFTPKQRLEPVIKE